LGAEDSLASRRFGCSICFSSSNYPLYLHHEPPTGMLDGALSHEGNVNGRLPIRAIMGTISLPPIHGVVLGLPVPGILSDCILEAHYLLMVKPSMHHKQIHWTLD
jgi:hypothetical protein